MDPNVWGPPLWTFMHTLSFNYEKNPTKVDKQNMFNFFDSLRHVIPCETCRNHYDEFFKKNNIQKALNSRDELIDWVLACHNNVNKLKKRENPDEFNMEWCREDLIRHYSEMYNSKLSNNISKCKTLNCSKETFMNSQESSKKKNLHIYLSLIICILLIIILYLIFKKK